jgi:hypothetical protein
MTDQPVLDLDALRARLPELRSAYVDAAPFPHIVLDDVLTPDAFELAVKEFPGVDDEFWRGYLHVNEAKYCNVHADTWSPGIQDVARALTSPEFVELLGEFTGIDNLLPDWSMDGGGLHQTLRGGHLNIHTDFSTHHTHDNWARRVNILLYLNETWDESWGGQLELWDKDMTACQDKVTPQGNRMLVFTTSDLSYHGHPDGLECPEGMARRSMALYYFTEEEQTERRSTHYRPRPQDGARRFAIVADRYLVDLYDRVKRRLGISDDAAQRALMKLHSLRRKPRG